MVVGHGKPSEEIELLLSAIDFVLEKLAAAHDLVEPDERRALVERAKTLRGTVEDWREVAPTEDERDDITEKILGLHVALSRMLRGESK